MVDQQARSRFAELMEKHEREMPPMTPEEAAALDREIEEETARLDWEPLQATIVFGGRSPTRSGRRSGGATPPAPSS